MSIEISSFSKLNKLTILIPSYNRQNYVIRCMRFWSKTNVNLLIIDGSDNSLDISKYKFGKNIRYLHSKKNYYSRLYFSIDLVLTEYVMLGCDDEFYIPSALNSCISTLESENDLLTCGGLSVAFDCQKNLVLAYPKYLKLKNLLINDNNSNKRIQKHFSNYVPAHIYSICRTKKWKDVAKVVFKKEYSFYSAMEFQIEFLLCYSGKTKILSELLWLRSYEVSPIRNDSPQSNLRNTIAKWWYEKNNKYKVEFKDFTQRMVNICKFLDKKNGSKSININQTINFAFKSLLGFGKTIRYLVCKYKIIVTIYNLHQRIIGDCLYYFSQFFKKKKTNTKLTNYGFLIEKKGVKVDHYKLREIEKIVIDFHRNKNI